MRRSRASQHVRGQQFVRRITRNALHGKPLWLSNGFVTIDFSIIPHIASPLMPSSKYSLRCDIFSPFFALVYSSSQCHTSSDDFFPTLKSCEAQSLYSPLKILLTFQHTKTSASSRATVRECYLSKVRGASDHLCLYRLSLLLMCFF